MKAKSGKVVAGAASTTNVDNTNVSCEAMVATPSATKSNCHGWRFVKNKGKPVATGEKKPSMKPTNKFVWNWTEIFLTDLEQDK